jgi:nitroreductase
VTDQPSAPGAAASGAPPPSTGGPSSIGSSLSDVTAPASFAALRALLEQRSSARGFLPEPIPAEILRQMFAAAQHAPSWCNVQPWKVAVTAPPKTSAVTAALVAAATSRMPSPEVPFPLDYPPPYLERRRACGGALYEAMGIGRRDGDGRRAAWLRNYQAFDAPHLAIVSCERKLGPYAYVDVGVWLGYLVAAAASLGLSTCPMASVAAYPEALRAVLPIAESEVILFGVALGRRDESIAANRCRTSREPIESNVQICE